GALGARALALVPLVLLLLALRRGLALLEPARIPLLLAVGLLVGVERLRVDPRVAVGGDFFFCAFLVHVCLSPLTADGRSWVRSPEDLGAKHSDEVHQHR